jgi:hypothetical protein
MQSELQHKTIPDIPILIYTYNSLNKLHNQSGGDYSCISRLTEIKALRYLYCTRLQHLILIIN